MKRLLLLILLFISAYFFLPTPTSALVCSGTGFTCRLTDCAANEIYYPSRSCTLSNYSCCCRIDCSCASTKCFNQTCTDSRCNQTCYGTIPADCSCAATTCIGDTCTDPTCNTTCSGTKDCSAPPPTPTTGPGAPCTYDQWISNTYKCSSDLTLSLKCTFVINHYEWMTSQTCEWGLCDTDTAKCPADPNSLYCERRPGCYQAGCVLLASAAPYYQKFDCYDAPGGTLIPPAGACGYTGTSCYEGCSPLSETCGGNAVCPPGLVSHIDNCNNVNCAEPCVTPPPGCTPDCSNAINVCSGQTFSDGCSGTCSGIKACVGTLTARAVGVTASTTSCANVTASSNYLTGTTISFSPAVSPPSQTQGAGVLSWSNVTTDGTSVYTVQSTPPSAYALGNVCVSQNGGAWSQSASGTLTDAGTLAFAIGYIDQVGWFQSTAGNVYASGQLTASIPTTATDPYVSLIGAGGTEGVVSYGTGYDFSLSSSDLGETQVSSTGWLAEQLHPSIDYAERLTQKLTDTDKTALTANLESLAQPSCATSPCFFTVEGDLHTASASPWTIGAGEQVILLVNGNVTISSNITIASGGFFALIARGNISIDPAVTTLDGLYVATNSTQSAVFTSGAGVVQLVVHGSVIADSFSLQRDLGGDNPTTPAESFLFDPQLLFTMPDELKEASYVWQEVAP